MYARMMIAFAVAIGVTHIAASVAHTSFIIREQARMGFSVPAADMPGWYLHDIVGLFPIYAGVVATGFLIAFVAAALLARQTPALRMIVFSVAGAVAVMAALLIMENVLGTRGVFGARGMAGLLAQGAAGALGGFAFARLKPAAD